MNLVHINIFQSSKTLSSGYAIVVNQGFRTIDTYEAGGNPNDSFQEGESSIKEVKKWALKTATFMFEENFGRKPKKSEIVWNTTLVNGWEKRA